MPARMTHERAARVLVAVREIATETGRAAKGIAHVSQRLRSWVDAGKMTLEEWETTDELLGMWELAARRLGADALVTEIRPQLAREARMTGVRAILDAMAKSGDMRAAIAQLQRAERIGETALGTADARASGFATAFDEISLMARIPRLPTGIVELDTALGGGAFPAAANVFGAGAKGGKSMFLSGVAAAALELGLSVFWATLENPTWMVKARLMSALLDIPTNELKAQADSAELRAAWAEVERRVGAFSCQFFPGKVTTWSEVAEALREDEERRASAFDVVIVDYIDVLRPSRPEYARDEYNAQGFALMEWRTWLLSRLEEGRPTYGWTATQSKRSDKRASAQRIDVEGLADSQNKARVLDLLVTGTKKDNDVELYVALARAVEDGAVIGPYPHAFSVGRYMARA